MAEKMIQRRRKSISGRRKIKIVSFSCVVALLFLLGQNQANLLFVHS